MALLNPSSCCFYRSSYGCYEGEAMQGEHPLDPLFVRGSHENQHIQILFENIFCIIMMNAAAPKRDGPAAVSGTVNTKTSMPRCA